MKLDSFWEEVDHAVRNPWEEAREVQRELEAVRDRIARGQEWFSKHTREEVGEEMWELAGRTLLELEERERSLLERLRELGGS